MYTLKSFAIGGLLAISTMMQPALAQEVTTHYAIPFEQAEFQKIEGVPYELAVLWGNPMEGPSAVFMKFPPNFPGIMHTHTHGYHAVVVSGVNQHYMLGENEADSPLRTPGDYWYQPGEEPHADGFPGDASTVLFIQWEGPMDFFPHEHE